jgi:hypothetical protein
MTGLAPSFVYLELERWHGLCAGYLKLIFGAIFQVDCAGAACVAGSAAYWKALQPHRKLDQVLSPSFPVPQGESLDGTAKKGMKPCLLPGRCRAC